MKTILYITAIFLFCSCSVFRKTKQAEYHQSEQTEVSKQDSLVVSNKDSTYTKEESSQNENTIEIEFDSSGGWLKSNPLVQKVDTGWWYKLFTASPDTYAPSIEGKIHKITIRNSQTISKKDSVRVVDGSLTQHSRIDSSSFTKTDKSEVVKSSRCAPPVWSILILLIIAGGVWAFWKFFK